MVLFRAYLTCFIITVCPLKGKTQIHLHLLKYGFCIIDIIQFSIIMILFYFKKRDGEHDLRMYLFHFILLQNTFYNTKEFTMPRTGKSVLSVSTMDVLCYLDTGSQDGGYSVQ